MKYLKKFNNINDYNDYEIDTNFQYPNVSLILEGGDEENVEIPEGRFLECFRIFRYGHYRQS